MMMMMMMMMRDHLRIPLGHLLSIACFQKIVEIDVRKERR